LVEAEEKWPQKSTKGTKEYRRERRKIELKTLVLVFGFLLCLLCFFATKVFGVLHAEKARWRARDRAHAVHR
jgi:hypothetical protein